VVWATFLQAQTALSGRKLQAVREPLCCFSGAAFYNSRFNIEIWQIMTQTPFDHELDTRGLLCPEPVMMLHQSIRSAEAGACIKVVATDPSTQRDIPKFCGFLGHTLVDTIGPVDDTDTDADPDKQVYVYWVQKKNR